MREESFARKKKRKLGTNFRKGPYFANLRENN